MDVQRASAQILFPAAIIAGVLLFCCAGVRCGMVPVNADSDISRAESWLASTVLASTVSARAADLHDPLQPSIPTLDAGMHLYAKNCLVCHGGASAQASDVARGLYQKPPQFGDGSMSDDPENITYWKIAHGIRFTGMPAFCRTLSTTQIWQITAFLHHIDALPKTVALQWRKIP